MPFAARMGDSIAHGSTITGAITSSGAPTVRIVGVSVALLDDTVTCSLHTSTNPNKITSASLLVKAGPLLKGIARVGDTTTCGATIQQAQTIVSVA